MKLPVAALFSVFSDIYGCIYTLHLKFKIINSTYRNSPLLQVADTHKKMKKIIKNTSLFVPYSNRKYLTQQVQPYQNLYFSPR